MNLITRTTQWLIAPDDHPRIYSPRAYRLTIDDQGGGEYLVISAMDDASPESGFALDPRDWPKVREAIDEAITHILLFGRKQE